MNGFWNSLRYLALLTLLFAGAGCASVQTRQNTAIARGIYSEQAAFQSGRFDIAEKYNEQLARLVPPPRKIIVVHPFTTKGKTYAVLPTSFKASPSLAIGSTLFSTALGQDKALQGQMRADTGALNSFSKAADSIVRAKAAEADKYEAEKPSLWSRVWHWGLGLSVPLLAIGAVLLCIFFPPAVPFVIATVRFILHFIKALLKAIVGVIEQIEAKLEKRGPSG